MILELFAQVMTEDIVNFADQSRTDAKSEHDIYSFYAGKKLLQVASVPGFQKNWEVHRPPSREWLRLEGALQLFVVFSIYFL